VALGEKHEIKRSVIRALLDAITKKLISRPNHTGLIFFLLTTTISLNEFITQANSRRERMGTALFWARTQRVVVILCRRFGTTNRSHFQESLEMERIGCPETSVRKYD